MGYQFITFIKCEAVELLLEYAAPEKIHMRLHREFLLHLGSQ